MQSLGKVPRPERPGFGKAGRPMQISANHFAVLCRIVNAFHYDVTIIGLRESFPFVKLDELDGDSAEM